MQAAAMVQRSAEQLPFEPADRLIVALDVRTPFEALRLVDQLDGVVSTFKIGLQLQLVTDLSFIKRLVGSGKGVFLDYKYYDIARTVREAVAQAADIGVKFLTVHGDSDIIRAAVQGKGASDLKLLSVTVLTSLDERGIQELGFECTVQDLVLRMARRAMEAGCDGVIASGQEARQIREQIGRNLLIVAPGIRPDGEPEEDQKRVTTPAEAITAGADYLVMGRSIYGAPDPAAKAAAIIADMRAAFDRQGAIWGNLAMQPTAERAQSNGDDHLEQLEQFLRELRVGQERPSAPARMPGIDAYCPSYTSAGTSDNRGRPAGERKIFN